MLQTLLWAASEIVPEDSRKSRLPNIYRLELALPRTRVKVMLTRENESSPTSLSSVNREITSYDWVKINESMQRNIPLQIWDSKDNDFFFHKQDDDLLKAKFQSQYCFWKTYRLLIPYDLEQRNKELSSESRYICFILNQNVNIFKCPM